MNTHQQSGDDRPAPLPLVGIKVIEIAQNLAGPYASEILAAMGADVLKVERPEGGDDARGWGPPFWKGSSPAFQAMNWNKRGITLDLKDPAAIEWLKARLAESDVLIQNLRPGTLDELGLDAATLARLNPRLVYCSLWAYGHKGPMRLLPGYEPMMQAFSGIFSVNGAEDGPTARVGMQVLDLGTGVWAALGCIAALHRRHATGKGGTVDASLFETALGWLGLHFATMHVTNKLPERHRSGNARLIVFEAFATRDGEIVVAAANDRLFAKLAVEIGHPEWAKDPRYATNALRIDHRDHLIGEIAAVLRTRDSQEWIARLEAIGVPCSPINDLRQVEQQPQTEAIGMFTEVPDNGLRVIGLPVSLDGERPTVRHRAPELGEHNALFGLPPQVRSDG